MEALERRISNVGGGNGNGTAESEDTVANANNNANEVGKHNIDSHGKSLFKYHRR